jgi:glucose/arabinose dehydrogenase
MAATASSSVRRGAAIARYRLPPMTGAADVLFYRGDAIPSFSGDLFVAAAADRSLLRVRFSRDATQRIMGSERLLGDAFGPLRAVATGPDGTLLVASEHALIAIRPHSGPTP